MHSSSRGNWIHVEFRAQSTRNSQTSSHFDGGFRGSINRAGTGRWKMSDKTDGSIFGDSSSNSLAIRRCRETNGLVDVYLLRRTTSIVEAQSKLYDLACVLDSHKRRHDATERNMKRKKWDKGDRRLFLICERGMMRAFS